MNSNMRRFLILLTSILSISCSDSNSSGESDAGTDMVPDANDQSACLDLETLQTCEGSDCTLTTCRGDEVCQSSECVEWEQGEFSLDFQLSVSPDNPLKVVVDVAEGGFPRNHVDALRFDFGDGFAGWGEELTHTYSKSGVYPVSLMVRLEGYRVLKVTKLAVLNPSSDFNPLQLTVNHIPQHLNGSAPALLKDGGSENFWLRVPTNRFDVNVGVFDTEDPIDPSTLALTATLDGVASDLTLMDEDGVWSRAAITDSNALAEGMAELKVTGQTQGGANFERSLRIETTKMTPARDPFDRPMVWVLRDDTDFFTTIRADANGGRYGFESTAGADGTPDFVEELTIMGAQGTDTGLNAKYMSMIRKALSTEVYRIFGMDPNGVAKEGVEFGLVWIGDEDAPQASEFSPQGEFSMMRLGGVFSGYLGYSKYSEYNEERIDDSSVEYGVATAGVIGSIASTFGVGDAFNAINPQIGSRLGDHPSDALVLGDSFDPYASDDEDALNRYNELKWVARDIAYLLAPVIAHEMGHAMGLMPDGLPPQGFFGGRNDVQFIGERTNSHHTDLRGLNLMQAGGNTLALLNEFNNVVERDPRMELIEVARLLSLETQLSPLSRAYLQGKLTYGER